MTGSRLRRNISDIIIQACALILALIVVFPVIYCVFAAFKTHAELSYPTLLPESFSNLENFRNAMRQSPLMRYMLNSFIVSFAGSLVRLVFSVLAAYVFAFFDFKGKNIVFILLLGTMMMPGDILLSTNYATVSHLGLLNTYTGICIVSFVSASQVFMLRQKFMTIPRSYVDAARLDGSTDMGIVRRILVPLSRPTLITLFTQSFLTLWNSYLWPLIVTASKPEYRTIMVGITKLNSWEDSNYELVLAGVTLSLIPSLILFIVMHQNFKKAQ